MQCRGIKLKKKFHLKKDLKQKKITIKRMRTKSETKIKCQELFL